MLPVHGPGTFPGTRCVRHGQAGLKDPGQSVGIRILLEYFSQGDEHVSGRTRLRLRDADPSIVEFNQPPVILHCAGKGDFAGGALDYRPCCTAPEMHQRGVLEKPSHVKTSRLVLA